MRPTEIWAEIHRKNGSYILYRKPGEREFVFSELEEITSFSSAEFVVCSFDSQIKKAYSAKQSFVITNEDLKSDDSPIYSEFGLQEIPQNTSRETYVKQVQEAVAEIKKGAFEKVVLSRRFYSNGISPELKTLLLNLPQSDSLSYVFCDSQYGLWAGVTPEVLMRWKNGVVSGMALAGTRVEGEWNEKEYQEQKTVSDYLKNEFEKYSVRNIEVSEVQTKRAGILEHLCSEVRGEIDSDTVLNLLDQLHPTPALGGFPKMETMRFIENTEHFNRELYGGYLAFKETDLLEAFVNIRCMRIYREGIVQFAGAGINSGSDAEKEWLETENKLRVLGQVVVGC
ncbi:MAG: hypothetical protein GC181_14205 [Bacteroidetes bacterium]|nr:hypothetical protein [Bacteroidota bacterium]